MPDPQLPSDAIRVSSEIHYLSDQSRPEEHEFVFTYTITIENESAATVQLINRHWVITDLNEDVQEVMGEGVVGQQPTLSPGEVYQYTSGTLVSAPPATMEGHYEFIDESQKAFKVAIPLFTLSLPHSLH